MARGPSRLRLHRALAGGLAAILLGLSPETVLAQAAQKPTVARPTTPPSATPPAARPTTPAATKPTTPPAAKPTTPPAAKPTTPPAAKPTPAASPARPTTPPGARPTTPPPIRPTTPPVTPPPRRPVPDAGPPPSLPDLGAPPSLPDPTPPPTTPTPTRPTTPTPTRPTAPVPTAPAPTPVRPTAPTPVRPAPTPTPPTPRPAPTPVPSAPPPAYTPAPDPFGIPDAPPPAPTDAPLVDEAVPSDSPLEQPLAAPAIAGDPLAEGPAPAKPTVEDLEALEKERARMERKTPKRWRHSGVVLELNFGTGGCMRTICRSEAGHNAGAGGHIGGFFGGNVFGILELGLEAGWNTLRPRDVAMKNAVSLYGLDPEHLEEEIAKQQGVPGLEVDFSTLVVSSAKSRFVNVGPTIRIHFLRKGRGIAYVGTGVHYQLWRNRYSTAGGDLRLDFHGLTVPLRAAGGAFVHPNIAIVGEFSYSLSYFFLGGVNHPQVSAVAPIAIVESTAVDAGASLKSGLPRFWNFTVNLRFRF